MSRKKSKKNLQFYNANRRAKVAFKLESNAVKLFSEYAKGQGCTWKVERLYGIIKNWRNKNVELFLTKRQYSVFDILTSTTIENALINGMAEGFHWTRILANVIKQLNQFSEALLKASNKKFTRG